VSCLRFGLSKVQDEERVYGVAHVQGIRCGLGDVNMVVEDVAVETETSRGKRPTASEVLVLSVRPKASQALPGL
jgi:hypothetical protein